MAPSKSKAEIEHEEVNNKLKALRSQMYLGGGEKRIASQHEKGKRTARERIEAL
jgi:acetyl-CoA carboxylase carboxyltransferase component